MTQTIPVILEANETKRRIFAAAAKLFSENGYNGVSMREISEQTGISKPMIYYYFGNKESIFRSLIEVGLQYNSEQLKNIMAKAIPIKEKILQIVKMRFYQATEYPELAKIFLNIYLTHENLPFIQNYINQANDHREVLVDLIHKGVKSGEFGPSANPELGAEIFVAALIHFVHKQLHSNKKILNNKLAEEIIDLLILGLNE